MKEVTPHYFSRILAHLRYVAGMYARAMALQPNVPTGPEENPKMKYPLFTIDFANALLLFQGHPLLCKS